MPNRFKSASFRQLLYFTIVEENYEYWCCKSFQIDSILPISDNYSISPRLKKFLKTDLLKVFKSIQFSLFQTITFLKNNFLKGRSKSFQIDSVLPLSYNYSTSLWLKKVLNIDVPNWFNSTLLSQLLYFTMVQENFWMFPNRFNSTLFLLIMVEENFQYWHSKCFQISSILPYSANLKNIWIWTF